MSAMRYSGVVIPAPRYCQIRQFSDSIDHIDKTGFGCCDKLTTIAMDQSASPSVKK
ncbi:MAG: hypothetical protein AB1582_10450 [Pseudomonadota bacterium]